MTITKDQTMKNYREGNDKKPFSDTMQLDELQRSKDCSGPSTRSPLTEGWRPPSIDPIGAQLFRVKRCDDGGIYWEVEVVLNGDPVRRRFAHELHARAWLAFAIEPCVPPDSLDLEELNGPFSAPFFAQRG